jgi:hypothetical protein
MLIFIDTFKAIIVLSTHRRRERRKESAEPEIIGLLRLLDTEIEAL